MAKPARETQDQQQLHLPSLDRIHEGADDVPKRVRKPRKQGTEELANSPTEPENAISVASRARRRPPPTPQGPAPTTPAIETPSAAPPARQAPKPGNRDTAMPQEVHERFLQVDNKYYFPDQTLAFVDRGSKLKAETNNAEVARSLVAIAEARGWSAINVTGSEQFRREVWREANRRDIEVRGYTPDAVELEAARRDQQRSSRQRDANPQPSTTSGSTSPSPQANPKRDQPASTGVLLEAGPAHYKFDPKQTMSYYVKLGTPHGERTLWGVDLERAVAESRTRPKPGDEVVVHNLGAQPVTLKVPVRNEAGQTIDHKVVETHRNRWLVEKPSYLAERASAAAAVRDPAQPPEELARQHPGFRQAAAGVWLGQQFAEQKVEQPEDRQRMLVRLRERIAQALEAEVSFRSLELTAEAQRRLRSQPPPARHHAERDHDVPDHVRA